MSEFKISRLKYRWRGIWTTVTAYNKDDVVKYGGSSWVCKRQHVSSTFQNDIDYTNKSTVSLTTQSIQSGEGESLVVTQVHEITTTDTSWMTLNMPLRFVGQPFGNLQNLTTYYVKSIVSGTKFTVSLEEDGDVFQLTDGSGSLLVYEFFTPLINFDQSAIVSSVASATDTYVCSDTSWMSVGEAIRFSGNNFGSVLTDTTYYIHSVVSSTEFKISARLGGQVFDIQENDTGTMTVFSFTNPGASAWEKMSDGYAWRDDWVSSRLYNPGDIVKLGGNLYLCAKSHTSLASFSPSLDNWAIFVESVNFLGAWLPNRTYYVGDLVRYGGYVYKCTAEHFAAADADAGLEQNIDSWTVYFDNIEFKEDWQAGIRYKENDLVLYSGSVLRCSQGHTSELPFDFQYWSVELPGEKYRGTWSSATQYGPGSVVSYGGYLYLCTVSNNNLVPSANESFWTAISKGNNLLGNWSSLVSYKTGDVVRRGGNLLVAKVDTQNDGSTLDYLDDSNWETLTSSQNFRNFWSQGNLYEVGDAVTYLGSLYKCNYAHVSDDQNYPGDNGSGFFYWDTLLETAQISGLAKAGDLLTYDLSRTLAGDGSTFGPTSVGIGSEGQLVTINSEDSVTYDSYNIGLTRVLHVSVDGVDSFDDPLRGIDPEKPFKTILFAAEHIENDTAWTGTNTIRVEAGQHYETLPITVPAKTVVLGTELRTTTIWPNPQRSNYLSETNYLITVIERLAAIMPNLITATAFTPAVGNSISQNLDHESTPLIGNICANLISEIKTYLTFYIGGTGTSPTVTGTNTATTEAARLTAILNLTANTEFIIEEAIAWLNFTIPASGLDITLLRRDIRRLVDSMLFDLRYPGNYRCQRIAAYFKNFLLGSKAENMFFMRDATGLRNSTLKGLEGSLNPPLVDELYRRPTGGAYVSLDPGWGPDDERAWINTRSPYMQGVTTFGTACVGQKIDGALHNGGNKSFVSNDFTQVLDDGIGAWVLNNARAELVSVFTYYAQIGYFAEAGGIIRATNGNCSYGDYGAIASGNDPDETPQFAVVNNRTTEALITSAFAGEANDEILVLEFRNAGSRYTQADYQIVGSGVGAEVIQEEFRDKGVFNVLVMPTNDAGTATGGGGYTLVGNNAQIGSSTTIVLATNTENTEAQLLGLRVLIISGTGTGQYGYIGAYNPATKVAQIYKESTETPTAGWDHVVPGHQIVSVLDTTTRYRIEPRLTFTHPGYTVTNHSLASTAAWSNVVYGETRDSYTNVAGSAGTGTVDDSDGLSPITASWNVERVGRKYTVTLANAGAGYQEGQTVRILGSNLGGLSPDNDIVVTVTSVSEDSTNNIVSFTYTGVGKSGVFVVTPASGTTPQYSANGTSWAASEEALGTSGNWQALASGNSTFVAIQRGGTSAAWSNNGNEWNLAIMPVSRNWNAVAYGQEIFVAVAGDQNSAAISINDGESWISSSLPSVGDSTINEWVDIAYGRETWLALANSNNIMARGTWSGSSMTWEGFLPDAVADSTQLDWVSITYGDGKFVAIAATGQVIYSFDSVVWYNATLPTPDGSTSMNWKKVSYGQGVFVAVCDTGSKTIGGDVTTGPTTYVATSEDGIYWIARDLASSTSWTSVAFGAIDAQGDDSTFSNNIGTWIAVSGDSTNVVNKIVTGRRAKGRCLTEAGRISEIRIWDPGSNYIVEPTISFTDPNNTSDASTLTRVDDGVLAQPTFINRGSGYRTSSTTVTVTGDGFGDVIPVGQFVYIDDLEIIPGPGAQFRFGDNPQIFTVQSIEVDSTNFDGTSLVKFRITPTLDLFDLLQHDTEVDIRIRYSQCRITGHDFLDVGTGNFLETNYPELYSQNYTSAPENEVYESDGGRVFYTSTDQSGNFRTGELFSVEQATGIVTISADFFDLRGLTELRLGGVRFGSGVVIREFSTDPLFTQDSNNVVPTQRAVKAYLQSRLSVGGSEISTPSFIAGQVLVGPNLINNTIDGEVEFPTYVDFNRGINGRFLADIMFSKAG